jgi:hypothetical protein
MRTVDQLIFGKELQDWQEFVDSYQGKNNTYWDNRNILTEIKNIDKPTFHIAGMSQDQDSRDTALTVKYIQENGIKPELHQTYLHSSGHGCGDFLQSTQFKKLLTGVNPIDKPLYRYSGLEGKMVEKDSYSDTYQNWDIVELTLENNFTIINNSKVRLYDMQEKKIV